MNELFDQNAPVVIDETKDWLTEFVGPDKKFKEVKELAKSKAFADAHIANLERSLAGLREEVKTRATAEDLINQITLKQNRNVDPNNHQDPPGDQRNINSNPNGDVDINALVEKTLAERETKRARETNLNLTTQKLRETYGDNAAGVLQSKAAELGLTTDYMRNMAQEAPGAFLALFSKPVATTPKDIFNAPPQSSYRTQPDTYSGTKFSDFQKVKAENPTLYWSAKFQRSIMDAAEQAMASGKYDEFKNH